MATLQPRSLATKGHAGYRTLASHTEQGVHRGGYEPVPLDKGKDKDKDKPTTILHKF